MTKNSTAATPRRCCVLFPKRSNVEPVDTEGCDFASGHFCDHEFIATDGRRYAWGDALDCDCEDCQSDEPDDWCIDYRRI